MEPYYYNQMSKAQRTAYHAMKTGLVSLAPSFPVPRLENHELSDIFFKLRLDCPEIFYAVGFHYRFFPDSGNVEMIPEYLFEKGKIKEHQKAMKARVEKLCRPAQSLAERDKEQYIHDFICTHVHYDKLKKPYSHEILGPLGQGVGVCEGIAKAVKCLCDRLGVWCIVALAENNPDKGIKYRHAWNVVRLGDAYYHLDATFDNSLGSAELVRYDYFNLDDRRLFRDHEALVYPVPACADGGRFYYREAKLSFTRPEAGRPGRPQGEAPGVPLAGRPPDGGGAGGAGRPAGGGGGPEGAARRHPAEQAPGGAGGALPGGASGRGLHRPGGQRGRGGRLMLREYLPFWARLTEGQQRRLEEGAAVRRFARGEMVYGGGTECAGLILPTEGQLRAYMLTDEGRELTLYRLFPRDMCLFSASCVLRGIQFDVLVEAERDTTALFLPAEVYQGLMEESAAVANYTSELMADRFSEVMWRMDQILSKKLDGRLAALLVEESRLAESASLRLTHDQLARHLGSAREVVSRLLKDFQNDGLVRLGRGGVELLDLPALEALASDSLR